MNESGSRGRRIARSTLIVVAIVALALLIWQIIDALLLIFIGVLFAVFWRGLAGRLSAYSPLTMGWSLAIVAILLMAAIGTASVLLGPGVAAQFSQLSETLPQTVEQLEESLRQTRWGQSLLGEMAVTDGPRSGFGNIFGRLTGFASRVLGIMTDLVLILFAAIFFAIDPRPYVNGIVLLVPEQKAERVRDALRICGDALWKWLIGKGIAMLFVGTFVTIGLLVLGVPLALVLGVIAGLLDFVPFIGPTVAAVPGILLGLTMSPAYGLYAGLVYFIAQQIEGNILTPLVQQKQVSLPPVLVLFAVIAGGLLFGILGVMVATPLAVIAMVLTRMLYVEDVLGKSVSVPGR